MIYKYNGKVVSRRTYYLHNKSGKPLKYDKYDKLIELLKLNRMTTKQMAEFLHLKKVRYIRPFIMYASLNFPFNYEYLEHSKEKVGWIS